MFKHKVYSLVLLFGLAPLTSVNAQQTIDLDTKTVSVSGLSSGGYMATQYHLSHADTVIGAGIVAAGPYNCARGSISTALSECVAEAPEAYPDSLFDVFSSENTSSKLAISDALKDDKVWLLHGTLDTRIVRPVANALHQQYQSWVNDENLVYVNELAFAHVFPTQNSGGLCKTSESPFIGNCDYDAAGEILKHIYGSLEAPVKVQDIKEHGELLRVKQGDLADMSGTGMHDEGFVFVPKSCGKGESCQIHVSFHGCNQSIDNVDNTYAQQAGFNEWAASNHLVVLYPQVETSRFMPMNPQSCWDWWGYTDENYANKEGKQIKAVNSMINQLADYLNKTLN